MAMANCLYMTIDRDVLRNCSVSIRKHVKFQIWGAKMFLRKFYQQLNILMAIFRGVFELLKFSINNNRR